MQNQNSNNALHCGCPLWMWHTPCQLGSEPFLFLPLIQHQHCLGQIQLAWWYLITIHLMVPVIAFCLSLTFPCNLFSICFWQRWKIKSSTMGKGDQVVMTGMHPSLAWTLEEHVYQPFACLYHLSHFRVFVEECRPCKHYSTTISSFLHTKGTQEESIKICHFLICYGGDMQV